MDKTIYLFPPKDNQLRLYIYIYIMYIEKIIYWEKELQTSSRVEGQKGIFAGNLVGHILFQLSFCKKYSVGRGGGALKKVKNVLNSLI